MSSHENVQKQLQRIECDNRDIESARQEKIQNLEKHRNRMKREIRARDYFRSNNDSTRKATDRVMQWVEETIHIDNQNKQGQWNSFSTLRDNDEINKEMTNIRKEAASLKRIFIEKGEKVLAEKVEMIQRIMARADPFSIKNRSIDKSPTFGDASKPPDEDPSQPKDEYPEALNHLFKLKNNELCKYDGIASSKYLKEAIEALENRVKP